MFISVFQSFPYNVISEVIILKNNIPWILKKKGIKQKEIADLWDITERNANIFINNKSNPTVIRLLKLLNKYDLKFEELFELEDGD